MHMFAEMKDARESHKKTLIKKKKKIKAILLSDLIS